MAFRRIRKFWDKIQKTEHVRCVKCGKILNDEEQEFYLVHCEKCELKLYKRLEKE